jgi:hypothetical protein
LNDISVPPLSRSALVLGFLDLTTPLHRSKCRVDRRLDEVSRSFEKGRAAGEAVSQFHHEPGSLLRSCLESSTQLLRRSFHCASPSALEAGLCWSAGGGEQECSRRGGGHRLSNHQDSSSTFRRADCFVLNSIQLRRSRFLSQRGTKNIISERELVSALRSLFGPSIPPHGVIPALARNCGAGGPIPPR